MACLAHATCQGPVVSAPHAPRFVKAHTPPLPPHPPPPPFHPPSHLQLGVAVPHEETQLLRAGLQH